MGTRISNDAPDPAPVVCIIDDDASVRRHLERQLRFAGYEVETFDSSSRFLGFSLPEGPTCLVLDVRLPEISGIELYQELKRRGSSPPVVFLTGYGGVSVATRAMKEGAVDFLEKPVRRDALLAAVGKALELSREGLVARNELRRLTLRYESLTPREREVMDCIVAGHLNKQIAFDLGITESTIKVHRARIMEKMGAGSLVALALMALGLGRVDYHLARASSHARNLVGSAAPRLVLEAETLPQRTPNLRRRLPPISL